MGEICPLTKYAKTSKHLLLIVPYARYTMIRKKNNAIPHPNRKTNLVLVKATKAAPAITPKIKGKVTFVMFSKNFFMFFFFVGLTISQR